MPTKEQRGHSGDCVDTEARPGPRGAGEQPQAETAGPGGHFPDGPVLQELSEISYCFNIGSSFFQTQGQQEKGVSGPWHLWDSFWSPELLGGKQTRPEKLSL